MDSKVAAVVDVHAFMTRSIPPLLVMHAKGRVPTGGWSNGRLVPWVYIMPPRDGIWDFDFIAQMPHGSAIDVMSSILADLSLPKPKWCKGVRIHGASGSVEVSLFAQVDGKEEDLPAVHANWVAFPESQISADTKGGGVDGFPWCVAPDALERAIASAKLLADRAEPQLDQPISSLIGRFVRVYHQGDAITMDYRPERLNIQLEADSQRIVSIYFG